MMQDKSTKIKR